MGLSATNSSHSNVVWGEIVAASVAASVPFLLPVYENRISIL